MAHEYHTSFTTANLESASRDRGVPLDALPFGVIVVDRSGTILEYNEYEQQLVGPQPDVIGKNFFEDVAPWAAVKAFEGRWDAFIASNHTSIVPFDFELPTPTGPVQVTVMFVRVAIDDQHATICIARKVEPASH